MVQSMEQSEGKGKVEDKGFPLILIPHRKEVRNKQYDLEIWLPKQSSFSSAKLG